MRLRRALAAFCSAAVLVVALVACGGAPTVDLAALRDASVGSWELYRAQIDGEEIAPEDCAEMSAGGMRATLDLDGDGQVLVDVFGSQYEGTWEMKSADVITITLDGDPADATLEDDLLTLSLEGDSMSFAKVSDKPVMSRDPAENAGGGAMEDLVEDDLSLDDVLDDDATGDDDAQLLAYLTDLASPETMLYLDTYVDSVSWVAEKGVVVADDETASISVVALGEDYEGDTGFLMSIENRTDAGFAVLSVDVTLDGAYVDSYATLVRYVPAGETKLAFMFFDSDAVLVDEGSSVGGTVGLLDLSGSVVAAYDLSI